MIIIMKKDYESQKSRRKIIAWIEDNNYNQVNINLFFLFDKIKLVGILFSELQKLLLIITYFSKQSLLISNIPLFVYSGGSLDNRLAKARISRSSIRAYWRGPNACLSRRLGSVGIWIR